MSTLRVPSLGASLENGAMRFRIWAPEHARAEVVLYGPDGERVVAAAPMTAEPDGYFTALAPLPRGAGGALYKYRVDGAGPYPDPFSRSQPLGVHGPSELAPLDVPWTDAGWRGLPLEALVIYEAHVGAATPEGTFAALVPVLDHLVDLGVNALELMPVAAFPGRRNWGYDGVSLYAPAAVYGGPRGLARLVDAAHARGIAVLLDVVYNHLGPDGNYLGCFSRRYFREDRATPWGPALAVDGEGAGPVRELLAGSAAMWIERYHVDGLRLDATHAIDDDGEIHILREIGERARAAAPGRQVVILAEDDRNEPRLLEPISAGGLGLDGVWADDFHHQMRRAFAGDRESYYRDFSGSAPDLAATLDGGWFFEGQPSLRTGGPRGSSPRGIAPERFVHFLQNHDQIGNRAQGERLGAAVSPAAYRAMTALLLLSPYTPLLFMGQEWGASSPFLFFTDHPAELGRAVAAGRKRELAGFAAFAADDVPDPQAEATFRRSVLAWDERAQPEHAALLALYRALLRLRAEHPALRARARGSYAARAIGEAALQLDRRGGGRELAIVINVRDRLVHPVSPGWRLLLSTEDPRFGGAGAALLAEGAIHLAGPEALVLER